MNATQLDGEEQEAGASTPTIRIVIAEDIPIVADGLATMLAFEEDMEVLETVESGEALLEAVERHRPDVALVDVNLIGRDGLSVVRELSAIPDAPRAIVLTVDTENVTVTRAVGAGAAGYLPKAVRGTELVQAVRAVAAGKSVLHPDVTRPFLERMGPLARAAGLEPLTRREQDVLEEVANGGTNHEIAERLDMGVEAVKTHLSHVYQKLGARDRTHAIVIAMRHGLVR